MSEDHTPRLVYESENAAVYHGDCFLGLQDAFVAWQPKVVLTDMPYCFWWLIGEVTRGDQAYNFREDIEWQANVDLWVQQWFPQLRRLLAGDRTVAWFFVNPHYLGPLVRWATWLEWQVRGLVPLVSQVEHQPELLAVFADARPSVPDVAALVEQAVALNTYGNNKSVEMLRLLLQASPPGAVLDPFCGDGSTLEAALRSGRKVVGFEIDEAPALRSAARVRAVEAELCDLAQLPA